MLPFLGLPHERQFTIICTLLKRREVGTGKSKKLAKRQAAYKMWQALQDNPPESFQPEEEVNKLLCYDFVTNSIFFHNFV